MNKSIFAFFAAGLLVLSVPAHGADHWQPISMAQSAVSFAGDNSFIKAREWRRRDGGTQERIKFAGGDIFYEEIYASGATWVGYDRKQRLRDLLANGLNKKEQKYQAGEVINRNFSKFRFDYLIAQSDSTKCLLGRAAEDSDGRVWHMNITACRTLTSKTIAKFEDDVFDILARVRFDGGELNKTRFALQDDPYVQTKPAAKKKQASESAPPPAVILASYPKLGPVASILEGSTIKESLKQYIAGYQALTGAKALVMPESGQSLYWSQKAAGKESEAIESATNNCQTKTKLACHVIAVNDDLAFNLDAIKNKTFK